MSDPSSGGRRRIGQLLRFVLLGGTNTLLTYAVFVALGLIIEPWIAYTIAFALGLAWTSFGSSKFVFGAAFSWARVLLFAACYLVVYGVGRLIIWWVDPAGLPDLVIASLVTLAVTTPLSFVFGRFIFSRPSRGQADPGPSEVDPK